MKASALVGLVRPFTLLAPIVGVGSGAVVAHAATDEPWRWFAIGSGLASALLATAASNTWNQAFDVELDRLNKPARPIPSGAVTRSQALALGHACALAALVLGGLASTTYLVCVAVGLAATWIYSAPPLRTKRSPWGALVTIAVPRGLLVPVAGWSILAPVGDPQPWILGGVVGLFLLGAAATKDFADVEGDRRHGCRTLPVVLGPKRAAQVIAPFLVVPFLLYPLAAHGGLLPTPVTPWWILGGGLAALGLGIAERLRRRTAALAGARRDPTWVAMYVLLLMAHLWVAVLYRSAA